MKLSTAHVDYQCDDGKDQSSEGIFANVRDIRNAG